MEIKEHLILDKRILNQGGIHTHTRAQRHQLNYLMNFQKYR